MTNYTADFLLMTRQELLKNFTKAGIYFTSELRKALNVAQPYYRDGSGRHYGRSPSAPGQFPKKLSGQLQKSITWKLDKNKFVLSVGSNLKGYPSFLQTGTKRMRPRPWLSLGFNQNKDKIGQILAGRK